VRRAGERAQAGAERGAREQHDARALHAAQGDARRPAHVVGERAAVPREVPDQRAERRHALRVVERAVPPVGGALAERRRRAPLGAAAGERAVHEHPRRAQRRRAERRGARGRGTRGGEQGVGERRHDVAQRTR
jgi:hypothetical protein